MENTFSADAVEKDVSLGVWINQSYGNVFQGATLTLDRRSGALLVAFIALYVSATGKAFWKITRFILHYLLSSTTNLDGVYHQRQAILCNSQTTLDAVLVLLNATMAWRKRARRSFPRLIPALGLALFILAGFSAAGLFSSRITASDANEVQLSSKPCLANDTTTTLLSTFVPYHARKLNEYITYTLQCYRGELSAKTQMCQTYPVQSLPYNMDSNASCPFSSEMCLSSSGNVFLDTGFLDSNKHFGINISPRFLSRYTRHCAPLVTEGYSEVHTDSQNPGLRTRRYFYGRANSTLYPSGTNQSYMYEIPIRTSQTPLDTVDILRSTGSNYKVYTIWTDSSERVYFTPIPSLDVPDARLSILFMDASEIYHTSSVGDPWFSATTPITSDSGNDEYFVADGSIGALGCATQVFNCNPELPEGKNCRLIYPANNNNKLSEIWPSIQDRVAVEGAMGAMVGLLSTGPEEYYSMAGVPSLLSGFSLMGPMQKAELPLTQWQKEAEYNFQTVLASLQASMIEIVTGKVPWSRMNGSPCEQQDGCRRICGYQKIRSTRFYSFSMLGIVIILVVGGIIMILGAFIEPLVSKTLSCLGRKNSKAIYALLEWKSNTTLQLQRSTHEELGFDTWSRASDTIPVTERGETLGVLDITDGKHPRWIRPASKVDFGLEYNGGTGEAIAMETKTPMSSTLSKGDGYHDIVSTAAKSSPRSNFDSMPLLRGKDI